MLSAKEARGITEDKNNNGVEETIKYLENKIIKQAKSGYSELFVSLSDLGKTDSRVSKVIRELNKQGYVVWNDGYSGKIIVW